MKKNYTRIKYACYTTNLSMAVIGNLTPILLITFRNLYGISYSLLGLLILINFCTQLFVDLIFSFFSHKFNIPKTVKFTPLLSVVGLIVFAAAPVLFPKTVYLGLAIGTVIFSASGGLAEVLISPTIAAIPSENPEREMSKLHSIYAWGVVFVVVIGTLFILAFGSKNWQILTLAFAVCPFVATIFFAGATIPETKKPEKISGALALCRKKELWLYAFAIFLGGATECTMAQWSSGYLEQALGIPKIWGDIFGVALFGVALGLGRSLYAKFGKNIGKVLFFGAIGATACYLICALVNIPVLGLIACAAAGFFASMMWPGSLIASTDSLPEGGVFLYAMMAAGGDLGASIGPQMIGVVTDTVASSAFATKLSTSLSLSPEQLGMKAGMLIAALFPLLAVWIYLYIWKGKKKPKLLDSINS
ncbi:MAG: MFS transporter [Clostridia bacterium]|nr:MFS transporter [Clostridia bacterium]